MINANLLEKVRQELKLTEEQHERYALTLTEVDIFLEENQVHFAEDNLLAFLAHMVTLLMRLETGEKVTGMGAEVLSQLEPDTVSITRKLLKIVEEAYGEPDGAEIVLVAIHVQTALEMMQEEM